MKASGSGVKRSQVVPFEGGSSGTYRAPNGYSSNEEGGGSAASYGSTHEMVSPVQRRAGGSSDALAERTYSAGGSVKGAASPAAGSFHHDDEPLHPAQGTEAGQLQVWQSAGSAGSTGKASPPVGRGVPGGSEPDDASQHLSHEYGHDYHPGEGYQGGPDDHHEDGEEEEDDGIEYDEDGNPIDEEYMMHHGGHYDEAGYYRSDKRITWSDEHGYALCEVFYCDRLHYSPQYNFEEGTATAHCCVVS